jgi:hypothetical protein
VAPHARQAVGLELEAHREIVLAARVAPLGLAHLVLVAEHVLHVVADLVGDDVGLGEVAGRFEALAQHAEEAEVEERLLLGRTVEGTYRRRAVAALGARGFVEDGQVRRPVLLADLLELALPGGVQVVDDEGREVDDLAVLVIGRIDRLRRLGRRRLIADAAGPDVDPEIALGEEGDQEQDHAADADPAAHPDALTAAIFEVSTARAAGPSHETSAE